MNSVIEFPKQNNFSLERPKIKNRDQNQLKLRQLKRNLTFLKDLKIEIKVLGNFFHEFNSVIRIIRSHDPPKTLIQLVILRSSLSRWSTSIKASNLDFMVILLETNFFEELVDARMVRIYGLLKYPMPGFDIIGCSWLITHKVGVAVPHLHGKQWLFPTVSDGQSDVGFQNILGKFSSDQSIWRILIVLPSLQHFIRWHKCQCENQSTFLIKRCVVLVKVIKLELLKFAKEILPEVK